MKNNFFYILLILLSFQFIFSAEEESIKKERLDIIKYGIDDEVRELIDNLKKEKNNEYNEILNGILPKVKSFSVKISILDLFIISEANIAEQYAFQILNNYENENEDLIIKSIEYLGHFKNPGLYSIIKDFIEYDNEKIAVNAIRELGKSEDASYSEKFISLYEDEEFNKKLKPELIIALGNLKAVNAKPKLIEILNNDDIDSIWRMYACDALGKIGGDDSLNEIIKVYGSGDTNLRRYAVSALSNFDNSIANEAIISSLRDSDWKIRMQAVKTIGEKKLPDSVETLIYKAKKDPIINVRIEAIEALGKIGSSAAYDYIKSEIINEKSSIEIRLSALDAGIKYNPEGIIEQVNKLLDAEWNRENSKLLEQTCSRLSKIKASGYQDIFKKMLSHKNPTVVISGIVGVKNNKISALKPEIEKLTGEKISPSIKKWALQALEEL